MHRNSVLRTTQTRTPQDTLDDTDASCPSVPPSPLRTQTSTRRIMRPCLHSFTGLTRQPPRLSKNHLGNGLPRPTKAGATPHRPTPHLTGNTLPIEGESDPWTLPELYLLLLRHIFGDLEDQGGLGRLEKRWMWVLSSGTWPEVLRRYMLTRAGTPRSSTAHTSPHVWVPVCFLMLHARDIMFRPSRR